MFPNSNRFDFITITCLNWTPLLQKEQHKNIIIQSLKFLSENNRVWISAFVIMDDHIHLIWKILNGHQREYVQRDFLKFTSQQILKILRNNKDPIQSELLVNAQDRKYQVWERNSLSIPISSKSEFFQKMNYIHNNPVKAEYVKTPVEYFYSSAAFYLIGRKDWSFLKSYKTHF